MIKRAPSWAWMPVALALGLLLNGATLGLTDDEAYYWVLSHRPALGYAFHPPAVAWLIAASEWVSREVGGFGLSRTGWVRLPAAVLIGGVLALALGWIFSSGVGSAPEFNVTPDRLSSNPRLGRSALFLLSFAGFFSLSWMMVPDTSLFFGWTLAFVLTWEIGHREKVSPGYYAALTFAVALSILSKYSGVLACVSIGGLAIFRMPSSRRLPTLVAVFVGGLAAAVPIGIWNSQHEWASLLYQLHDRHAGASLSFMRYLRFWGVEIFAAGPILIFGLYGLFRHRKREPVFDYALFWALPGALVFCIQPLFSDFKPHWAFIVWWPAALALAQVVSRRAKVPSWAKGQMAYGLTLGALVLLCCHFPLLGPWIKDSRMDVTNDLYGWSGIEGALRERYGNGQLPPVVGSRYQTASQAAFALDTKTLVTLIPRDLKARDEWPMTPQFETYGPEWPELRGDVIFLSDNRYSEGPRFKSANCHLVDRAKTWRGAYVAKWIEFWDCRPITAN